MVDDDKIIIHIMTYFPNDDQGGREQYYRMDETESRLTLADRLQVKIKSLSSTF